MGGDGKKKKPAFEPSPDTPDVNEPGSEAAEQASEEVRRERRMSQRGRSSTVLASGTDIAEPVRSSRRLYERRGA